MNKLKQGAAVAETSKLLAAAAAAAAAASNSGSQTGQSSTSEKKKSGSSKKNLAMGDKLNKNTVASLLAKSRELASGAKLTPEELENAERSWSQPELTIEPIFKGLKPDSR